MPWPTLESLILDIRDRLTRIESYLSSNLQRLELMDHRQDRIEDRINKDKNKDKIKLTDLLPYLFGALIVGLTALGKSEWADAVATVLGR